MHSFSFVPGTVVYVLTVARTNAQPSTQSRAVDYLNRVTQHAEILTFQHNAPFIGPLQTYLSNILDEFSTCQSGRKYAIEWLVKMVIVTLYRALEIRGTLDGKPQDTPSKIYDFQQLIEAHFRQQLPISEYAQMLGISVSTLNRLCHKEKGNSAKQLVNERLFIEAKRRLLYTQIYIDQIAYSLGFEDPAYFSRFFKQKSGLSPSAYRQLNPFETEYPDEENQSH